MAFTKVVGAGIHTLSNITSHNINSSGIITATKFVGPITGGGGINAGILTNVVVTSGDGGYLTIEIPTSGSVSYVGNGGSALSGAASGGNISGIFLAGHGSSDFSHQAGNSTISIDGGRQLITLDYN